MKNDDASMTEREVRRSLALELYLSSNITYAEVGRRMGVTGQSASKLANRAVRDIELIAQYQPLASVYLKSIAVEPVPPKPFVRPAMGMRAP